MASESQKSGVHLFKLARLFGKIRYVEMTPRVSLNFISHVTYCRGLREDDPQTTYPMSITWASYEYSQFRANAMINSTQSVNFSNVTEYI